LPPLQKKVNAVLPNPYPRAEMFGAFFFIAVLFSYSFILG